MITVAHTCSVLLIAIDNINNICAVRRQNTSILSLDIVDESDYSDLDYNSAYVCDE